MRLQVWWALKALTAFWIGGLGFAWHGVAAAEPVITEERVYYSFNAADRGQIWQEIQQNSPKGTVESAGEHLINVALTEAQMRASYQYVVSLTKCRLKNLQPSLHIKIHMPHWQDSWKANELLAENWSRYVRMVSEHEEIHKQYAIQMVQELEQTLLALGEFKRCDQLKDEVEKARQEVIAKYRAKNAWFDAKERVYRKGLDWF